jgi:hypothetical protein
MPTPSLILVPARFKTGKLYTPLATTSGGVVLGASGDFNVTRATTATRVNASGLIEVVASGIPRLDYFASGGVVGCPALLVEPSAQNAFIQSQTLFTSHLVQNLTTAGYADVAISPDGTQNAEKFVPNTTNGVHGIADITSQTITSGTTYTFSCFAKSDGGTNYPLIVLQLDSSTAWGATRNAIFNVVSGTIHGSAPSGVTMRIQDYGSGWYRFSATATAVGSVTGQYQYRIYIPNSSATLTYAAASGNTEGVFVWGAQLETGSVATSYIPTTAAAVTRNADVVSLSGAVSGSIGQTEGTLYAEVDLTTKLGGLNGDFVAEVSFDANTKLLIRRQDGSTLFEQTFRVGGTNVFSRQLLNLAPGIHKFALAYKTGNNNVYVDGSSVLTGAASGGLTNTFTITNAMNRVDLGHSSLVANTQFKDRIRALALYTTRLTNAELATLTTL